MPRPIRFVLVLCLVLIPTLALAATAAELESRTAEAIEDSEVLHGRIAAGTDPLAVLEAEFDALEVERQAIQFDRDAIVDCSCPSLDEGLSDLDALSEDLRRELDNWDDQQ